MSAYKELSEYFSTETKKKASIIQELSTKKYIVRLMNDSGTSFSATFESEEDAEGYAEEWVTP